MSFDESDEAKCNHGEASRTACLYSTTTESSRHSHYVV